MGVAVKQEKGTNSYYMHDVYVINMKGTAVGNTQSSLNNGTPNSNPIFMILNSIAKIKDYLSLAQKGETNLTEQDKTNLRTMVDQEAESKFANSKARGKDVKLLNAPPKIVHR